MNERQDRASDAAKSLAYKLQSHDGAHKYKQSARPLYDLTFAVDMRLLERQSHHREASVKV